MLKALRTAALLLALIGTAHAGEMLTPPAPQPPPQQSVQEPTTEGDMHCPLVEIALTLLALF